MKYCRKCGMLLEDTTLNCIRCGSDVTLSENYSLFPIEVMETLDAQKEERKKRTKIVILIVVIFTLLAAVIAMAAIMVQTNGITIGSQATKEVATEEAPVEEVVDVVEEEIEEAPVQSVSEEEEVTEEIEEEPDDSKTTASTGDRTVKDVEGNYYNFVSEKDEDGNVVLNVLYPEDFDTLDFSIDYEKYSTTYPISMNLVVSGEEESIRFIYMSPQQLWYRNSETGKSRTNERDISYYMSYYTFEDAKSYIEGMLNESYPKARIDLVSEKEINATAVESVNELAKKRSKMLFGNIGDYAHIGDDTTYANMDATSSAFIYEYEIITPDKQMVFDKFYVPVVANNLYYASDKANDRGTVTEWYCLAFFALEAGNEDLYEDYADDFDAFIANTVPTDTFLYINQQYGKDISDAIDSFRAADPLTDAMLKEYSLNAKKEIKLNELNEGIKKALMSASNKTFAADGITINAIGDTKVVFVNEENGKAFLSKAADEYPGDEYTELVETDRKDAAIDLASDVTEEDVEEKAEDTKADKSSKDKGVGIE